MIKRFFCLLLCTLFFLPCFPSASGYTAGESFVLDLSDMVENPEYRRYIQMMVDYEIRTNTAVHETLEAGYCALFLFEGCSDNMDDWRLSDISYYRVSAVCLAVRLDADGVPYLAYYNEDCSTLPDRPLEYGAWNLEAVGPVGPATICDGTYELYSVRHGGSYEALNVRTSEDNDKIPAVYMTPGGGYVTALADEINIHTRTGNHTIQGAMWSAGCLLVGDGDFWKFSELIASTYYTMYDFFQVGDRVGTVTINRQYLKDRMYVLYENSDAVDMLLAQTRQTLPQTYLNQCQSQEQFDPSLAMWTTKETGLMTLPCSNASDARSVALATIPKGEEFAVVSAVRNTAGNLWYEAQWEGQTGYIFSGYTEQPGWFGRLLRRMFL